MSEQDDILSPEAEQALLLLADVSPSRPLVDPDGLVRKTALELFAVDYITSRRQRNTVVHTITAAGLAHVKKLQMQRRTVQAAPVALDEKAGRHNDPYWPFPIRLR